jgi:hypothetical protein
MFVTSTRLHGGTIQKTAIFISVTMFYIFLNEQFERCNKFM